MGYLQIKEKLENEFNIFETEEYSLNEKDIVYLFVEARKIIQHDDNSERFCMIKFYADWIVHIQKDHIPTFIYEIINSSQDGVNRFVDMQHLKQEMEEFFKEYDLSPILIKERYWHDFWKNLINVLSEQPLFLKKGTITEFVFRAVKHSGTIIYDISV